MKQQLEAIRKAALDAISDAGKAEDLEALRVRYLGKKGELTAVLKQMGKLSAEERPVIGQLANDVRAKLEADIEEKTKELADKAMELKLKSEAVDVTIPGKQEKIGVKHPMYQVLDEIKDIFVGMGFEILEDREVELAEYNFTKLNVEEGHPAREWSDTFYFTEDSSILLRTQTSPMQIHAMETRELPIRILAPGRVYRKDEVDATHSPMFHQIEGMAIDKGITMADLKSCASSTASTRSRASARIISRSPSRAAKWISSATSATARAARPARARAGSRSSARAWCIPRCSRAAASTPTCIPAGRSAWALSVWRSATSRSATCV